MKSIFVITVLLSANLAQAQTWNANPSNWKNDPNNWNNNPNNWVNSPNNWANSPNNISSTNGVYDNNGNRIGYAVRSPEGVVNIFGNDGTRIGFQPSAK